MKNDPVGDIQKEYEVNFESKFVRGLPILARMDGRAFHSFTKGLTRPYDERLSNLMQLVTKYLVEEFNAKIGYTQSDEISLMWNYKGEEEPLFGGRVQKLCSTLSASTTLYFNKLLFCNLPEKQLCNPTFDARVWNIPSPAETVNYFIWRERDAMRNSISMAAQSFFSHNELQGKSSSQMQEMLWAKHNINWNDYPSFFKRGVYFKRIYTNKPFTADEIDKLPLMHDARKNPDLLIERSYVERAETSFSCNFDERNNLIWS